MEEIFSFTRRYLWGSKGKRW